VITTEPNTYILAIALVFFLGNIIKLTNRREKTSYFFVHLYNVYLPI